MLVSLIVVAAMAILALTFASCGRNSKTEPATSQATSTTASTSPATTALKATGKFKGLQNGSTVTFSQEVVGAVSNLPQGTDVWLVVRPNLAPQYWPQPGPVMPDPDGQFHAQAYFGASSTQNSGEKFLLLLVAASPTGASLRFQEFVEKQQGIGMTVLPVDTKILAQITVKRS